MYLKLGSLRRLLAAQGRLRLSIAWNKISVVSQLRPLRISLSPQGLEGLYPLWGMHISQVGGLFPVDNVIEKAGHTVI